MDSGSTGGFWLYAGFVGFVLVMLALDLGVFHRKTHEVRFREALTWSAAWIALALTFNLGVWTFYGEQKALELRTGVRLLLKPEVNIDPTRNPIHKAFRRLVPSTDGYRGQAFLVREGGKWLATRTRSSCSPRIFSRSWGSGRCTSCWLA